MKRSILLPAIMVAGIVIGWLCRGCYFNVRGTDVQRDTIVKTVVETYGPLELKGKTYKIDVPKFNVPDYYWIELDSTKIEFRDSIRYIVLPSENYHTRIGGIDIYHHGVRSEIDSVSAKYYTEQIREKYKVKEKKHGVTLYGSIGYVDKLRVPVGLKYLYRPLPWLGAGAKIEYDFVSQSTGVYATTEITFGW